LEAGSRLPAAAPISSGRRREFEPRFPLARKKCFGSWVALARRSPDLIGAKEGVRASFPAQ